MRTLEPGVCLAPGERWRAGEQEAIEREARIWQLLDVPTLVASSFMRPLPSHGVMLRPSRRRDVCGELSLYGHEGCAQTRLVREALSSLQLAYTLVPFGTIGGTRRCPQAANVDGPVLVDGDKAVLHGAANATQYLEAEYSLGKSSHSDNICKEGLPQVLLIQRCLFLMIPCMKQARRFPFLWQPNQDLEASITLASQVRGFVGADAGLHTHLQR